MGIVKAGLAGPELFEAERSLYIAAIAARQIGFGEPVVWLIEPDSTLRARATLDKTRNRKQLEKHILLVPWMHAWFQARERVLATRATPHAPGEDDSQSRRYDPALADKIIAMAEAVGPLPTKSPSTTSPPLGAGTEGQTPRSRA